MTLDINKDTELPFKIKLSFNSLVQEYKSLVNSKSDFVSQNAQRIIRIAEENPVLIEGFDHVELFENYKDQIDELLEPTFSPILTKNEIKVAHVPFYNYVFKSSERFKGILDTAGPDFKLQVRNLPTEQSYIIACAIILKVCYGYELNFKRPFFYDIPDADGIMRYYKILYNADFIEVVPSDNAIEITQEDFDQLLDNFENIELWKEKFPPNSYELKGFIISNIFDVTDDQSISNMKAALIKDESRKEEGLMDDFNEIFRSFLGLKDVKVGFSIFNQDEGTFEKVYGHNIDSFLLNKKNSLKCSEVLCSWSYKHLLEEHKYFSISDIYNHYKEESTDQPHLHTLYNQGIRSAIFAPIADEDELMGVLEIVSDQPKILNSINANKLVDVMPYIASAIQRSKNEEDNLIKAVIQKEYTSIHPSVYWRFEKQAKNFIQDHYGGVEQPNFSKIAFEEVYPLYGQLDIKGSSQARNWATQQDLMVQLNAVKCIFEKADNIKPLPIFEQYIYQINEFLSGLEDHFQVDSEQQIMSFLNDEIDTVLTHVRSSGIMKPDVDEYLNLLDLKMRSVYKYRKAFDDTISMVNKEMAAILDEKQIEAQEMYPHYFERFKTDGVEHNMYIGESITKDDSYNPIYLYNLRLWQLQIMCEMENSYYQMKPDFPVSLDIASMILVFSQPLSVSFRSDEKQFDVDGTYNARYEIVKKRVDKAYVKGTTERVTQKGKLSIVYSQKEDEYEYLRYIKFLQSKHYLDTDVEVVELEDLQAVTGLKALRVSILYHKSESDKTYYTYQDLMDTIKQS